MLRMFSKQVLQPYNPDKTVKVAHGQERRPLGPFKHFQMDFMQIYFALNWKYVPCIKHLVSGHTEVFSLPESYVHTWEMERWLGFVFLPEEFPFTSLMTVALILLALLLSSTFTEKLHCPFHLEVLKNSGQN